MASAIIRSTFAFFVMLSSASRALADVPPEPDPSEPTMLFFGLTVVVAASAIGYFVHRRRRK